MDFILKVIEAGVGGIERIGVVNFIIMVLLLYMVADKVLQAVAHSKLLRQVVDELRCTKTLIRDFVKDQAKDFKLLIKMQAFKLQTLSGVSDESMAKILAVPDEEEKPPCPPKEKEEVAA